MATSPSDPSAVVFMASRLGYGLRIEEYPATLKMGIGGWLEQQLAPPQGDDAATVARLQRVSLHIKYDAVADKWPAMDENRGLVTLDKPIEDVWGPLFEQGKQINGQERGRPRLETMAALMTRAVYSPYQLREVIAQFWHDHFHVNAFSDDHISVALPTYDREVIRKNCFGNFRTMLQAVASSTAMLYFLSNRSSRAGAANENYGRELFELHTFGREAYLNDQYDRWRDVPGAADGHPVGYIDQDVYESARAFTGWTVEDGSNVDGGRKLPNTGKFAYIENWHDGYQKRVLGNEFDPFQKPMADGEKVLDLIAEHPATGRHVTMKLCHRMIGPDAPQSIMTLAAEEWQRNVHAPDQIGKVIRLIASSVEFEKSRGTKVKRPLALMANYVRIMGYDFAPSEGLSNQIGYAGQKFFAWPTPTGLPDDNAYFVNSNAMRNRWQLLLGLAQNAWNNGVPDAAAALQAWGGQIGGGAETVSQWFRIFGVPTDVNLAAQAAIASGLVPFAPPLGADGDKHIAQVAALAAMSPEFQSC